MTSVLHPPDIGLGAGLYTFPEAARLLSRGNERVVPQRLRSWVNHGLTPAVRPTGGDELFLTFLDLVSLEIVRRLHARGASMQKIRRAEEKLRMVRPGIQRPFATHSFFTDGVGVWVEVNGETEELVGRHAGNLVWEPAIRSFAEEIRFDHDASAFAWDIDEWVELDPTVQFGAPVVRGTRIPVATIKENLAVGTPEQVAEWYQLSVRQVRGVAEYLQVA